MLRRCQIALHGAHPLRGYHVPGRIEVLGKHTDYAGGRSLVAATENGLIMAVAPREDRLVRITSVDRVATIEFEMHPELQPSAGTWANYPMTVARRVARNFPGKLHGAEIAIASDLPQASGLSSSSALVIAIFLALADINALWERTEFRRNIKSIEDLGGYLGTNENGQTFGDLAGDRGVGTFGGSQDHTAILGGEPGKLKMYRYCPVRLEAAIDFPSDWVFAIASSGVVAEKTGAAMATYNRVSQRVSEIVQIWQTQTGRPDATLHDAIHSAPDAHDRLRAMLKSREHLDRFDQFVEESSDIVPAVGNVLRTLAALEPANRAAGIETLGRLVDRSQEMAEKWLGNQTRETSFLARSARDLGAFAASAFGAGFGGSVWAMIEAHDAERFLTRWAQEYEMNITPAPANPVFFVTRPGGAARRIEVGDKAG